MKFIRTFILVTILLCLLLGITACSKKESGQVDKEKHGISFLHYFSGTLSGGIDDMVAVFNREHPDYSLKATPLNHEAFKVSIRESLNRGDVPDLFSYWGGALVQSEIKNLQSLDDVWEKEALDDSFDPSVVSSVCTYNGKKYFLPITQHFVVVFYNKKVFQEAGVRPPKDWKSFLSVCDTIKNHGKTPIVLGAKSRWPAQFWFDYILLRTAPFEYRQKLMEGKASYTDTEVRKAFGLWDELLGKGYFNDDPNGIEWDTDAMKRLAEGNAAMTLMGTWGIQILNGAPYNLKPEVDYDYFEFPVIDPNVEGCSLGPLDGIVVPKAALNPEGAKAAIAYFAGPEPQKAMSKGSGAFAPNKHIPNDFYTPMQQRMLKDIRKNAHWAFNYDLATPPTEADIGLDLFRDFLEFHKEYKGLLEQTQKQMKSAFEQEGSTP